MPGQGLHRNPPRKTLTLGFEPLEDRRMLSSLGGEIHGWKWSDLDGNGRPDPGEPGLAGWKIYLDDNLNRRWDTGETHTFTDGEGNYCFPGLDAGTYVVAEVTRDGWQQTFPGDGEQDTAASRAGQHVAPPESIDVDSSWVDGSGPSALANLDWRLLAAAGSFSQEAQPAATGVYRVYVEPGLLAQIDASLDTYVADLAAEGYQVAVREFGGTAAQLRSELQDEWMTNALEGALFLGDLPYVSFTSEDNYGDPCRVTYPHDLYFMDLDGSYLFHGDGLDEHTAGSGDVAPEIYVSRITTGNLAGVTGKDEAALVNDYFAKVHAYRIGALDYSHRGIVFADDDWDHWGAEQMQDLYPEVLEINDPLRTTKQGYLDTLQLGYESILECLHSSATAHDISGEKVGISNREIFDANPRPAFYNMFNCAAARFTVDDYLAGIYVYGGDFGLGAVGSTKTGSMLSFPCFYRPQAEGDSLGEAFMRWFSLYAGATDVRSQGWMIDWFNGMTMQGDPTLRPASMPGRPGPSAGTHTVELQPGQVVRNVDFGSHRTAPSEVTGRHVFYNGSAFDRGDPAADARDDDAIATDKSALMPGQTATLANYTSYSRGINGILVDVEGLPGTPGPADFEFRVGNSQGVGGWQTAPDPTTVAVRRGDGVDGSDRITLVFNDNDVQKQWLQVTVLATPATGLAENDVFYFGNAVAEAGNSPDDACVDAYDMLAARDNQRTFLNPAPIDFRCDFNRDARVNAFDMLLARDNQTHFLNALKLITTPRNYSARRELQSGQPLPPTLDWLVDLVYSTSRDRRRDPVGAKAEAVGGFCPDGCPETSGAV